MMQGEKQYTRDLSGLDSKTVLIIGYQADAGPLIDRLHYAKQTGLLVNVTITTSPDTDFDIALIVTDQHDLPEELASLRHYSIMSSAAAARVLPAHTELRKTDWLVLRELERKFLSDTELSQYREKLRARLDDELKTKLHLFPYDQQPDPSL